jgi:hypothetical protein
MSERSEFAWFYFCLSSAGKAAKQVKAEGARGLLRGAAPHPLTRQKAKLLHFLCFPGKPESCWI